MTQRKNLSILVVAQLLAFGAGAFAEPVVPVGFDGGPGCGTVDMKELHRMLTLGVADGIKNLHGSPVLPNLTDLQDKQIDPEPAAEARLQDAEKQLDAIIADLEAKITSPETPPAQLADLIPLYRKAKAAKSQVHEALAKLARDGAKNDTQAKLDSLMAQAAFFNKTLASFLGKAAFGGRTEMKEEPFELEIGGDAIFEAVRRRVPFLGGAVGGRLRVRPGEEMVSRFNSLKAEYYTTLLEASQTLKDMGKKSSDDKRLTGMAKWGKDTNVIYPGQSWTASKEILSFQEYNSIVD